MRLRPPRHGSLPLTEQVSRERLADRWCWRPTEGQEGLSGTSTVSAVPEQISSHRLLCGW